MSIPGRRELREHIDGHEAKLRIRLRDIEFTLTILGK